MQFVHANAVKSLNQDNFFIKLKNCEILKLITILCNFNA